VCDDAHATEATLPKRFVSVKGDQVGIFKNIQHFFFFQWFIPVMFKIPKNLISIFIHTEINISLYKHGIVNNDGLVKKFVRKVIIEWQEFAPFCELAVYYSGFV
jgi:hypothetical protein